MFYKIREMYGSFRNALKDGCNAFIDELVNGDHYKFMQGIYKLKSSREYPKSSDEVRLVSSGGIEYKFENVSKKVGDIIALKDGKPHVGTRVKFMPDWLLKK